MWWCSALLLVLAQAGREPTVYRAANGARVVLGDAEDAADAVTMDINDIGAVIDMTGQSGVDYSPRQDGLPCMKFATGDWQTYLDQAVTFIDTHLSKRTTVFVHCVKGCKGAGSLSIAYLMMKTGVSFDEAYADLQMKRPCVDQIFEPKNEKFLSGLRDLSKKLQGKKEAQGEL